MCVCARVCGVCVCVCLRVCVCVCLCVHLCVVEQTETEDLVSPKSHIKKKDRPVSVT